MTTAPTKLPLRRPPPDIPAAIASVEAALAQIRAGRM
jgi:hypothetical protein